MTRRTLYTIARAIVRWLARLIGDQRDDDGLTPK